MLKPCKTCLWFVVVGRQKLYLRVGEATIFLAHTYKVKTTPKSYNSEQFFNVVGGGGGGSKMYLRVGEATIFLAHTYKVKTTTPKSYNSEQFFNVVGGGGGVQKCTLGWVRLPFSLHTPTK